MEQLRQIQKLVMEGYGPKAIHMELKDLGLLQEPHPAFTERTIGRYVERFSPPDASGNWTLAEADAYEAALVFPVLSYAFQLSRGRYWLTRGVASWVARVRAAVPSIPDNWAYSLARAYRRAEIQKHANTRCLDAVLAVKLWTRSFQTETDDWRLIFDQCEKMAGQDGIAQLGWASNEWFDTLAVTAATELGKANEGEATALLSDERSTPISTPKSLDSDGQP